MLVDDEEIDENTVQIDDIFELEGKENLKKSRSNSSDDSSSGHDDDESNDEDSSSVSKKAKKDRDMSNQNPLIPYPPIFPG